MSIKSNKLYQQAFSMYRQGNYVAAEPLFSGLLKKQPDNESVLYLLGTLKCQLAKHEEGSVLLKKAVDINPNHVEALNNLGLAYVSIKQVELAEECYRQALKMKPDYAHAWNNLGGILDSKGELNESLRCYQKALNILPEYAEALFNIGRTLQFLERYSEAEHQFLKLLEINPNHYNALNNLGAICKLQHRPEDALVYLHKAVTVKSDSFDVYNNLATIYQQLNQFEQALSYYDKAISLKPDRASVKWNRATVLLMMGRLKEGWEAFEWRRDSANWKTLPFPEWQGESLVDKTLLVFAEQGLGDEILFASCFPDLIKISKHCIIECDPRLGDLYRRSFPEATIKAVMRQQRDWLDTLPEVNLCVPMGSIPRFLRQDLKDFPDTEAFLTVAQEQRRHWKEKLDQLPGKIKVGISWRSQLSREGRHLHYSRLEDWHDIFALKDVQFVNLQYDECQAELDAVRQKFGITIHQFNEIDLKNDLNAVAALCSELDVVISAGTAVAEIAAAVGAEVLCIEAFEAGWISLGTDYLPWHPQVVIFKQQQRDDWSHPLSQIAEALGNFEKKKGVIQESVVVNKVRKESDEGEDYLLNIRQLLKTGAATEAYQQLSPLVNAHEDDAELWELKGVIELSENRLVEAEKSFRQALSLAPWLASSATNLAKTLLVLGNEEEAESYFKKALQLKPGWAEAHNDLANLLYEQKRDDEAEEQYLLALRYKPDQVEAHNNLGSMLLEQGKIEEAIHSFNEALRLRPHFAEAHYNLANALSDKEEIEVAIEAYQKALLYKPAFYQAHFYLGNCYLKKDNYFEAEACFRNAIEVKKDYLSAHLGLSGILCKQEKYEQAEELLLPALEIFPDAPEIYSEIGHMYREQGMYSEAEDYLLKGLVINDDFFPLYLNLGVLQDITGRYAEAKANILKALELKPDNAETFANLAKACSNLDQHQEAESYCRQAIAINPELVSAYVNLSYSLQMQGKHQEAIKLSHQAIEKWPGSQMLYCNLIRGLYEQGLLVEAVTYSELVSEAMPENFDMRLNLALAYLSMGNFSSGWVEFQRSKEFDAARRNFPFPEWRGEKINGKLLIYANQGVGDELLFASCFAEIINQVPQCVIECDPRLEVIFQRSFPQAEVYGSPRLERNWLKRAEPIAAQVSMDIVPSIVRKHITDFPEGKTDYLRPDPERILYWQNRVDSLGAGLKVGIAWRSGSLKGGRNLYYSALDEWGDILKTPGIQFINLQYDECEDELNAARDQFAIEITNFQEIDLKNDLDDASALTSVMDLMISAGTTSAEIASAVGIPVWRMEAYRPAWDLFGTDQAPWHPNVEIFKQVDASDWEEVLGRIAKKLTCIAAMDCDVARSELVVPVFNPKTLQVTVEAEFMQVQLATKKKQWQRARQLASKLLKRAPEHADLLHLMGAIELNQENYSLAQEYMERSLSLMPDSAVFLYDLGLVQQKQRNLVSAIEYYRKALVINSSLTQAHNNLANILAEQEKFDEAEGHYRHTLEILPNDAQTYNNLGVLLKKKGDLIRAIDSYRQAIENGLKNYQVYSNLGNALLESGELEEAEQCYRNALELNEKSAYLLAGLADALRELGRLPESLEYYQNSIELESDNNDVQWNIALTLLAMGDLENGWLAYDWRLLAGRTKRDFPYPEWDGAPMPDKTLLVYAEQGIGDEILFASCFNDLISQVGRCIIECEPRLEQIYQRSFPKAIVRGAMRNDTSWTQGLEPIDAQIPVGSLPLYLRRSFDCFPQQARYLLADPKRSANWHSKLSEDDPQTLKVGVIWRSGVMDGRRKRRFSDLLQWSQLLSVPGVTFYNLQYDLADGELENFSRKTGIVLSQLSGIDLKQDFNELAAAISALDLVIGAGTSTVALAAALGKPVWKLDPFMKGVVDLGQDYAPWFPSVRIFRQTHWNDWNKPLQEMTSELTGWHGVPEESHAITKQPCRYGELLFDAENDLVGHSLALYGEYAQQKIDFFANLLSQGAVVIDAGAHIGELSVGMANIVGETGQVIAVEAKPSAFEYLKANVKQLIQIQCINALANDSMGQVPLWELEPYASKLSLQVNSASWNDKMRTITLDSLNLSRCDLLRINVEAGEVSVLQGAFNLIKKHKPFIYIENFRQSASSGVTYYLQKLGYEWMLHQTPLFNKENYADNAENAFADHVLVSILATPKVVLDS